MNVRSVCIRWQYCIMAFKNVFGTICNLNYGETREMLKNVADSELHKRRYSDALAPAFHYNINGSQWEVSGLNTGFHQLDKVHEGASPLFCPCLKHTPIAPEVVISQSMH